MKPFFSDNECEQLFQNAQFPELGARLSEIGVRTADLKPLLQGALALALSPQKALAKQVLMYIPPVPQDLQQHIYLLRLTCAWMLEDQLFITDCQNSRANYLLTTPLIKDLVAESESTPLPIALCANPKFRLTTHNPQGFAKNGYCWRAHADCHHCQAAFLIFSSHLLSPVIQPCWNCFLPVVAAPFGLDHPDLLENSSARIKFGASSIIRQANSR